MTVYQKTDEREVLEEFHAVLLRMVNEYGVYQTIGAVTMALHGLMDARWDAIEEKGAAE